MNTGIYKITHTESGKVYVGSSKNLTKRKQSHFYMLANKTHHSAKLQNAFNKYGEGAFVFEVIELCLESDLLEREQHWMNTLDSYNTGYNCSALSHRPTNKIATKSLEQNQKYIDLFVENMGAIKEMRADLPESVWISLFDLNIAPKGKVKSDNALFKRYWQATNIVLGVLCELPRLDQGQEYRLHYITYFKNGEYELSQVKERKTNSHDRVKTDDIYSAMMEDLITTMESHRFGKYVLDKYKDSVTIAV